MTKIRTKQSSTDMFTGMAALTVFLKTAYTGDGRCFSFIEDIDSQKVIAMQEKYAADMDYASFSIEDIRLLSENLANRTEWIDILFSKLRYQVNIPLKTAHV